MEQQDQALTTRYLSAVVIDDDHEEVFASTESQEDARRKALAWGENFARHGGWVKMMSGGSLVDEFMPSRMIERVHVVDRGSDQVPAEPQVKPVKAAPGERLGRYRTDPTYRQFVQQVEVFLAGALVHYDIEEAAGMLQLGLELVNRNRRPTR